MKKRVTLQVIALGFGALIAGLGTGCGDGVLPADNGAQTFSPLQTSPITSRTLNAPPSDVPPEVLANYGPIIDGFEKNSETLLRRNDIEPRLEQIESVYVATGRYLELVAIYQTDVEKHGLDSAASASLVWAWMQIGQRKKARDLIDRLIKEKPQSATTWFLEGAYWLPDAQTASEPAKKTIAAWQKTLELDPGFSNFKSFNAATLRQQISHLQQRVASSPLNAANAQQSAVPAPQAAAPEKPAVEEVSEPVVEAPRVEEKPVEKPEETEASAQEIQEIEKPQESADVLVAQGQIALSRGQQAQARMFFTRALAAESDNIGAAVGMFNVRRLEGAEREVLLKDLKTLAAHPKMTAQHAYELGMFAVRGAKDNALAIELFERTMQLDAGYAERAGVPALVKRLKAE